MNRLRASILLGLLLSASALAAAGSVSAATVDVHLSNAMFVPATIAINANDTVNFINDDSFAHDVTFEAGFSSGATGSVAPGHNWSHTFTTDGVFRFRCTIHSTNFDSGMVGKVTVGATPAPPKSPGFELAGALAAVAAVALIATRLRNR